MKQKLAFILVVVMAFMSVAQSVGAINVIMNSSFVEFPDQEPVIKDGVTLVPIRPIAEKLGLEILWDDPTDTVTLKKDNFYIELVIGSLTAKTSSGTKTLSAAPEIINGRTMVPLRFIAEELGLTVSWNAEYQRVVIAGEVDTEVVLPPVEEATDVAEETPEETTKPEEKVEKAPEGEEPPVEEESMASVMEVSIDAPSATVSFEIPLSYLEGDTESEEGFAFRSLDAFDVQHTYNWELVSRYECYTDDSETNGILFIVQELMPYEGEEYDVARATDEYPDEPERVEFDYEYIFSEVERLIIEQICAEKEIEIPEGYEDMEDEELAIALGFESGEEMSAYMEGIDTGAIMYEIPEYVAFMDWQVENSEYRAAVREIDNARNYAIRNFSSVQEELDDETWAMLFSQHLNTDEEVRYDNVELIDFDGKKLIHAIIYAQDPDDEQGTYEYYQFVDGDCVITIFGGTLFGGEPYPEITDILSLIEVK